MQIELDNPRGHKMNLPQWSQTHNFKEFLELIEEDIYLGHNKNKENNMTDFEIKETVVQTGYVDKDGKFVPETDPSKVQPMDTTRFVQTDEDIVSD